MTRADRERLFTELFASNQARIQRLCYGYLGPCGEVEDLFQEIMVNVWNSLPSFRGESLPFGNLLSGNLAGMMTGAMPMQFGAKKR